MGLPIDLRILPQPNDTTCGPTCLEAIYQHYGDSISLEQVIEETPVLPQGGTLGVWLALHALRRGYRARIYTYNLHLFDPTWFRDGVSVPDKLREQMDRKADDKLRVASQAYLDYLAAGGELAFTDLSTQLLRRYLKRGVPILTGLSVTYLHHAAREDPKTNQPDDVGGLPVGHFVVLAGYDRETRLVTVADPLTPNPLAVEQTYRVPLERLVGAILLGVITYDANLVMIDRHGD